MRTVRTFAAIVVFLGFVAVAGDSQAVIYKYLDEKGDPVYVDDLTKVPEPVRDRVVLITGKEEQELTDDAERARAIAARQAALDLQTASQNEADTFLRRLVRSGVAVAVVVVVLFVMMNFDALTEREAVVRKVRIALIAGLVLFLGFTHAPDVAGLFRTATHAVPSPLTEIKEKQAEKGKKAAESYKNVDQVMQEKVQSEVDRIQRQIDAAEGGK